MTSRTYRTRQGGQAIVEFALVVPVLLLVVFAAIEFGSAFWTYQQLSAATSEGARKAAVSRTDPDRDNTIINHVKDAAPNLDRDRMTVTVTSPTWDSGDDFTVVATYPERITLLGLALFDDDLRSERTGRVEQ